MNNKEPEQQNLGFAQGACEVPSHPLTRLAAPPVVSPRKKRKNPQPPKQAIRWHSAIQIVMDELKASGENLNAFVNEAVRVHLKKTRNISCPASSPPRRVDEAELRKLLAALNKVGGLSNQQAALANKTKCLPSIQTQRETSAAIIAVCDAIMEALNVR